jgi:hypothetical protein
MVLSTRRGPSGTLPGPPPATRIQLKPRCTKSKKKRRSISGAASRKEYLERVRGYGDTEPYREALRKPRCG